MKRGGPLQRKTPLRAKTAMKRTAPMPKKAKPKAKKPGRSDPSHLRFVRSLPCCRCKRSAPSQACHLRSGTDGGTGMKPSDCWTIPGCADCHSLQHRTSEEAVWTDRAHDLAIFLAAQSGDYDRCLNSVMRF